MPTLPWTAGKTAGTADPGAEAVVMASRFQLRTLRDVPGFLAAAMRVRRQMLASPGVLGVSLIAKPFAKTFWTLSAWQDRPSLEATIGVEPHRGTMNRYRPRTASSRFVFWSTPVDSLPPAWPDAMRRVENDGFTPGGQS